MHKRTACNKIKLAIERFAKRVVSKNSSNNINIAVICYDETDYKDCVQQLNKQLNKKLIIFISLFDENDREFMSCYKDWLFVIKHFAHVLKLPITLYELRNIVDKGPKEYLPPQEIEEIYNNIKKIYNEMMKKRDIHYLK